MSNISSDGTQVGSLKNSETLKLAENTQEI